jgi:hypothetical protein
MSANQQPEQHHYTPPWLDWIATNVVPSAMIGAEFIIAGLFFVVTSVRNPYDPHLWSILEWALVIVAGFVGLAMAGLSLKLSGMAAEMLATSHYIRGAFTFGGVLVLALIETWAGIVERAALIGVGTADLLLADYSGIDAFRHIPTSVFMVSFLLPCLVLWYGWASRPPVVISAEEQSANHARKLAEARFKAELNEIRAGGAARMGVAFKDGLIGKRDEASPDANADGLDEESGADNVLSFPGNSAASRQARSGAKGGGGLPKTHVRDSDILAYIHETLKRIDVTIDDVKAWMSQHHKASRANADNAEGITLAGAPYIMRKSTAHAEAKKKWPPRPEIIELAD